MTPQGRCRHDHAADPPALTDRASAATGTRSVSRPVICTTRCASSTATGRQLTMRRLSDRGPRSHLLYRHIPQAALLDGVAEVVLANYDGHRDADWAAQLRAVAHDFRRLALAHPNVVPLLVTRPLATPLAAATGVSAATGGRLALLRSAGCSAVDTAHLPGALRLSAGPHPHRTAESSSDQETDDVLRLGLHRLTITEFPQVRAGIRAGLLRRRRRTRPRPRPSAHRP
jgi:hypothetical protein